MKNIPFIIFGNIALMGIILFEIFKNWNEIKADNSDFAISIAITIPIISIMASVIYIKQNKL